MTEHGHDHDTEDTAKIAELVKGIRIAMLTQVDAQGRLFSKPMATQDVEFDGDVLFIGQRSSQQVQDILSEVDPQVNIAYSGSGAWVSVSGTAEVLDDPAKLEELWGTFTDAWMEGGPDNPENVLIRVHAVGAEYWEQPGGKVTQLVNLVRTVVAKDPVEGENRSVDL